LRSGVNDCPGPPSGGGGTGWSRRGLGEATYNGGGLQSWESGLSATQSIRSDPLKTAKDLFFDLCEPGHGRIQRWQLKACAVEPDAVDFPFARSVVIVRSERTVKKTAVSSFETRAYICSDLSDQRTPYHWLELIRGHWAGVEIRNHWKRDAPMGEAFRCRLRIGLRGHSKNGRWLPSSPPEPESQLLVLSDSRFGIGFPFRGQMRSTVRDSNERNPSPFRETRCSCASIRFACTFDALSCGMANISKSALRSRLTQSRANSVGARGFHHNPQDFSDLVGVSTASSQEYLKKNWHYLSDGMRAHAARLSTSMLTVNGEQQIDTKTGQFGLALG